MLVSGRVDVHDFHRCTLYPSKKLRWHQWHLSVQSKPHRNFGNDPSLSQANLLVSERVLFGIYLGTKSNNARGALVFRVCFIVENLSGQIIATSHNLAPNGGLVREITLFQGNLG